MSQNGKVVYTVLGVLSIGTMFVQIWGLMFGFLRVSGWTGIGITMVCLVLAADGHTTLAQRRLAYESQMHLFDDEELMEYRPCLCSL